jgi:ribose transport system substrate-binding protein
MSTIGVWSRATVASLLVASTAVLAACGSSSSAGRSGSDATATTGAGTVMTGSRSLTAATTVIAPYVGHPSPFPATLPLTKRPDPGAVFDYLQCSTPVCAQIGQLLAAPTKALGVSLKILNAGATAASSQAAAAAALASKPAAVLIAGVDPQLFGNSLKQLDAAGIPVVGAGIIDGAPYGVEATVGGTPDTILAGKLMAAWVVAHNGAKANIAFFGTPQLSFSATMQAGFDAELHRLCPSCAVSNQQISVLTFGTTAPSQVVAYLQSHPSTTDVVFATEEAATGLAAALKDAGQHVTTMGFAPTPSNLQDIASGGLTAGLGLDLPVQAWDQVNVAARLLAHDAVPASQTAVDLEFLTSSDVTPADIKNGWSGYPDVAQRFEALWSGS